MIFSLIISLILTIVIELIISFILGIRNKEDVEIISWVNVLTNPVVVCLANYIKLLDNNLIYIISIIILEIIVIIVEFMLYKKYLIFKDKSPLLISSINNILSFLFGIIINIILKM